MNARRNRYRRHRFPPEIIAHAIWLYHRFSLSFRDIEGLPAERGIVVSYESIRRRCRSLVGGYVRLKERDTVFASRPSLNVTALHRLELQDRYGAQHHGKSSQVLTL